MKVFWSWQSDHDGKISRHFVRGCIEQALAELKIDPEFVEAARDAELDHDRKGIPGIPDLANTIFRKIESASVFVADVSSVGASNERQNKLINHNVALEVGYALKAVSDSRIVLVMNEEFGSYQDLPFDLRHKAGPITYRLAPNATADQIRTQKTRLVAAFKIAIGLIISSIKPLKQKEIIPHTPLASAIDSPGRWFGRGAIVVRDSEYGRFRTEGNPTPYTVQAEALFYVRVVPINKCPDLSRTEAQKLSQEGNLLFLTPMSASGRRTRANSWGAATFDSDQQGHIIGLTQLTLGRELWSIDTNCLSPVSITKQNEKIIPSGLHERMIAHGLHHLIKFSLEKLEVAPPIQVHLGAVNIDNYYFAMGDRYINRYWGPINDVNITLVFTLHRYEVALVNLKLLEYFNKLFDSAGYIRPEEFNGFPGQPELLSN